VSIPLVGTWTSSAVVTLVGLAVAGWSTLPNMQLPTGFRVPQVPSLLTDINHWNLKANSIHHENL
jgi:hypothetical protein